MYIGKCFGVDNSDESLAFMRENCFGLVVSVKGNEPFMTHLPLVVQRRNGQFVISGHFAKNNPHSDIFRQGRAWVAFLGENSYISSKWYGVENEIPTWNYSAVHCEGSTRTFEDERELREHLLELMRVCERTTPGKALEIDPFHPKHRSMIKKIVGFQIFVDKLEHKMKMNQNLPLAMREGAIANLKNSDICARRELALKMEKNALD